MKQSNDIISGSPQIVKRVAIYVRVSTAEQKEHGISIDDQLASLKAWAEANHHVIAGIYNDAGISARARYTKRPDMLRMLADCEAGKIDLIVMTKLDRFFRNIRDFYEVLSMLEQYGVAWKTIREDYETETAAGRLKLNIMMAVAQDEADRTSERIKAAFEYKKSIGEWQGGKAPIGYMVMEKNLVKNPEEAQLISDVFDYYTQYSSMYKAAELTGLTVERVRWILHSETYTGMFRGVPCEAYITQEQHQRILSMLQRRSRRPAHDNVYIFSGLIRCSKCGRAYSGVRAVTGQNRYRCSSMSNDGKPCGNRTFAENWLETAMIAQINDAMQKTVPAKVPAPRKQRMASTAALESKLERLKELYIEGDISKKKYDEQKQKIQNSIEAIRNASTSASHDCPDLPDDWLDEYRALEPERKKTFWAGITDVIYVGEKITAKWY